LITDFDKNGVQRFACMVCGGQECAIFSVKLLIF